MGFSVFFQFVGGTHALMKTDNCYQILHRTQIVNCDHVHQWHIVFYILKGIYKFIYAHSQVNINKVVERRGEENGLL